MQDVHLSNSLVHEMEQLSFLLVISIQEEKSVNPAGVSCGSLFKNCFDIVDTNLESFPMYTTWLLFFSPERISVTDSK